MKILLVDDDPATTRVIKADLERRTAIRVHVAASPEDALERIRTLQWDAVVSDLVMPRVDGVELTRRAHAMRPELPIVLLTAHASIELAVDGIRAGAADFLQKPVDIDALTRLLEKLGAESKRPLPDLLGGPASLGPLIGADPLLDAVRTFARYVARVPGARVLITGESGTGKSLLAKLIHDLSGSRGRFVQVNCAALPANLLESELFGYQQGAFTDAKSNKSGLLEAANNGTILLDEIGAMPIELQAKLLLFLENQEVRRLGGIDVGIVEARVIAATNEDLAQMTELRKFRADLLYRLDVASIRMPSLRDMPATIPALVTEFVQQFCSRRGIAPPPITSECMQSLQSAPWPGNVRELKNAIERALIFHESGPLRIPVPPTGAADEGHDRWVRLERGLPLEEVERRYLAAMLSSDKNHDLASLAEKLGISRKALWAKRKRHRLQ